jgi:RNA polymerase sigma-70 factor, ECF subfamily
VNDPRTLASLREIDARLRPFVARRVRASDVDDVVQEVWVRVLRGIDSVRDEERFGPWLYSVARRALADHGRARARHGDPRAPEEAPDLPAPHGSDTSEEHDAAALLAHYVAPFVAMLPSPYREALTLTELEGLTQKQAATMLGISLSGMKSRVQRGRRLLRETFEACCNVALDVRGRVLACEPRPDGRLPDCRCARE